MKHKFSVTIASAAIVIAGLGFVGAAAADDVKMIGSIVTIKLAPDGKSATAVLKDVKSGEPATITITDDLTLDKFKDKRIVAGDEIRAKFDKKDGKNNSLSFKKTAGC